MKNNLTYIKVPIATFNNFLEKHKELNNNKIKCGLLAKDLEYEDLIYTLNSILVENKDKNVHQFMILFIKNIPYLTLSEIDWIIQHLDCENESFEEQLHNYVKSLNGIWYDDIDIVDKIWFLRHYLKLTSVLKKCSKEQLLSYLNHFIVLENNKIKCYTWAQMEIKLLRKNCKMLSKYLENKFNK
ncbi:hypothetical protein GE118_00365 [Mycoplasma sp. NEAQ87857]|uniref:hypothetical protein n=1 Tax=Mycoplasma sp. NEAQ87857 TaxID=2683967 RepID=UPI001316DA92|nr:hypothetical protein [Mycoplasma sp. NEAQ87857]QGZ97257.1 hypothetical protein GE118_00365 [Mycoplasma sp. NEAQ87857]